MKFKIVITVLVSLLFITILVSCAKPTIAPTPPPVISPTPEPENLAIPKLEPVLYLTNGSYNGAKLYGVYEFNNQIGQHCTIVADIQFIFSIPESNSSPSITCK